MRHIVLTYVEQYLRKHNPRAQIHNISYISITSDIDSIARTVSRRIKKLISIEDEILIVAHSLGGLIARAIIPKLEGYNITHMVTLGTPHLGAHLANVILKMLPFVGDIFPIVHELKRNSVAEALPLPQEHTKFGIIIGVKKTHIFNILTIVTCTLMRKISSHDGVVEVNNIPPIKIHDLLIVNEDHLTMIMSHDVAKKIHRFITNDKF
jgi:hypothetical protein